jgi:hypothetical protein
MCYYHFWRITFIGRNSASCILVALSVQSHTQSADICALRSQHGRSDTQRWQVPALRAKPGNPGTRPILLALAQPPHPHAPVDGRRASAGYGFRHARWRDTLRNLYDREVCEQVFPPSPAHHPPALPSLGTLMQDGKWIAE